MSESGNKEGIDSMALIELCQKITREDYLKRKEASETDHKIAKELGTSVYLLTKLKEEWGLVNAIQPVNRKTKLELAVDPVTCEVVPANKETISAPAIEPLPVEPAPAIPITEEMAAMLISAREDAQTSPVMETEPNTVEQAFEQLLQEHMKLCQLVNVLEAVIDKHEIRLASLEEEMKKPVQACECNQGLEFIRHKMVKLEEHANHHSHQVQHGLFSSKAIV